MKLTCNVPYEKRYTYEAPRRPSIYSGESLVSEVKGESITVSFELGEYEANSYGLGHLCTRPHAINEKNVDALLKLLVVKPGTINAAEVPNRYELPVVVALLGAKGWGNVMENFDMLHDQSGWGMMGGSGCGRLQHQLKFTKVLGVKPSLTGVRRTLAAMQFNGWLGEVKEIRQANKHLRDAVKEDELFVTWGAHPICQESVHFYAARGFLVRGATDADCSCTKCAKKLNIPVNAKNRRMAGVRS